MTNKSEHMDTCPITTLLQQRKIALLEEEEEEEDPNLDRGKFGNIAAPIQTCYYIIIKL